MSCSTATNLLLTHAQRQQLLLFLVFYIVQVYCFTGSFIKPILRSFLTMSGVQVMVINIRNGTNTLWQAYATTKVLASVATVESLTLGLTPIFWRAAWTSIPLNQKKKIHDYPTDCIRCQSQITQRLCSLIPVLLIDCGRIGAKWTCIYNPTKIFVMSSKGEVTFVYASKITGNETAQRSFLSVASWNKNMLPKWPTLVSHTTWSWHHWHESSPHWNSEHLHVRRLAAVFLALEGNFCSQNFA